MATNLQWLYDTNGKFRDACREAAKEWLGSTSTNFSGSWLERQHETPSIANSTELRDAEDTCEKLKADILRTTRRTGTANQEDIWRWCNRQAAITESESIRAMNRAAGLWAKKDQECRELEAKVDELTRALAAEREMADGEMAAKLEEAEADRELYRGALGRILDVLESAASLRTW